MKREVPVLMAAAVAVAMLAPALAGAGDAASVTGGPGAPRAKHALEPLVPAVAGNPLGLSPGPHAFLHRIFVSPGFGSLGNDRLFVLRVGYHPATWIAYEGAIGHSPSQSVHAILHTFDVILRRPMSGRFQPYLTAGYGMTMVLPGRSVNADPVTKNTLVAGGGLELYIRDDLALRAELRGTTVLGQQLHHEGIVAYEYREQTIGLSFSRPVAP